MKYERDCPFHRWLDVYLFIYHGHVALSHAFITSAAGADPVFCRGRQQKVDR